MRRKLPPWVLLKQPGSQADLIGAGEVHAFLPGEERVLGALERLVRGVCLKHRVGAIGVPGSSVQHRFPERDTLKILQVGSTNPFVANLAYDLWLHNRPPTANIQERNLHRDAGPAHVTGLEEVEVCQRLVFQWD